MKCTYAVNSWLGFLFYSWCNLYLGHWSSSSLRSFLVFRIWIIKLVMFFSYTLMTSTFLKQGQEIALYRDKKMQEYLQLNFTYMHNVNARSLFIVFKGNLLVHSITPSRLLCIHIIINNTLSIKDGPSFKIVTYLSSILYLYQFHIAEYTSSSDFTFHRITRYNFN